MGPGGVGQDEGGVRAALRWSTAVPDLGRGSGPSFQSARPGAAYVRARTRSAAMPRPLVLAALLVATASAAGAQLAPGTEARRDALDALRVAIRSDPGLRGTVVFHEVQVYSDGTWFHVSALPHRPDGRPTSHCHGLEPYVSGLLHQRDGRWEVLHWATCYGDVWQGEWSLRFGVPASVTRSLGIEFPYEGRVSHDLSDGFLSLRSAPSVRRGRRLARMPESEPVTVLRCELSVVRVEGDWGRWCRTRYDGREGWAFSAYMY